MPSDRDDFFGQFRLEEAPFLAKKRTQSFSIHGGSDISSKKIPDNSRAIEIDEIGIDLMEHELSRI